MATFLEFCNRSLLCGYLSINEGPQAAESCCFSLATVGAVFVYFSRSKIMKQSKCMG